MEGAPRSRIVAAPEPGVDRASSDHWYNVLGGTPPGANQGDTGCGSVREPNGARDGLDRSIGGAETPAAGHFVNTAGLLETVRQLAEQNGRLADRLDALTQTQERHAEQRGRLESKIDRLCGMLAAGQSDERQPLDDAICGRITETMKPFFLAIIDLLELSMRPAPAAPDPAIPPQGPTADQTLLQPDEPPGGGLPEILIKPLEELIDGGRDRARSTKPDDKSQRGSRPTAAGTHPSPQGSRSFLWTPVIPEASNR